MAPFYKGYQKHFRLGTDDVEAVQALYGKYYDKVSGIVTILEYPIPFIQYFQVHEV